jgi:preprotein translocase subunit SecG
LAISFSARSLRPDPVFTTMASVLFRTVALLVILFLVVYIGTENTHQTAFHFGLLLDKPAQTSAALVYFAVFAVGVIGGTLLNAGRGSAGGRSSGSDRDSGSRSKKK